MQYEALENQDAAVYVDGTQFVGELRMGVTVLAGLPFDLQRGVMHVETILQRRQQRQPHLLGIVFPFS